MMTFYLFTGNEVLCKSGQTEATINELERKNLTKIVGKCSSLDKRMEYNIQPNHNERAPIIVDFDGSTM